MSELGSTHLHVDGVVEEDRLMKTLKSAGLRSKIHQVLDHLPGSQRERLSGLYRVHTTGFPDQENFKSFSTTELPDLTKVDEVIALIQQVLCGDMGVVLELEMVIAKIDDTGKLHIAHAGSPTPVIRNLDTEVVHEYSIEVHHGIDIADKNFLPKRDLPLGQLLQATSHELDLGGWFVFQREDGTWSYRSNSFTTPDIYREKIQREYVHLKAISRQLQIPNVRTKTLVERVLGIRKL